MNPSAKTIGAITLFVADVQQSKTWYQKVFDLPLLVEDQNSAVLAFDNTVINLLAVRAAPELIAPAHVAPPRSGAQMQFTIWVDDVDAASATIQERGVTLLNGPMNRVWGQRTICFADPDGHIWELAQQLR